MRLVARLQELGFDITLAEAERRGRGMTGRPHFAQLMVEKGYVKNLREAFDEYLDESAIGSDPSVYFSREEWERTENDTITLEEVRRALSSIDGSLSDAVIESREER